MNGAIDKQIEHITGRLSVLNEEQRGLKLLLEQLQKQQQGREIKPQCQSVFIDPVTPDKIELFMSLFRGREDVFPKRWDNPRTGKSGYSPVCKNEWAKNVCNKPRISCSACTNQAFLPITKDVIHKHLCGDNGGWQQRDYTIGVYAMLKDETC